MTASIFVALSSHGFGHAAQTCVVLNALAESRSGLTFDITTNVPHDFLIQRLRCSFEYRQEKVDPELVMESSLKVLPRETFDSYSTWFSQWDAHVEHYTKQLEKQRSALVLTNVAFTVAPAAKRAGIPVLGFCSLNWADIFAHYCGHFDGAMAQIKQMQQAYGDLDRFIRLTPAMPMSWLRNAVSVPPIVRFGVDQRQRIIDDLGVKQEHRLVLVGFGGIDTPLPLKSWPMASDISWLFPAGVHTIRKDMLSLTDLNLSYIDALASCDVVVTKPGYGTFVEAAFAAKPVVYIERDDWPEQPYLVDWLGKYVATEGVQKREFYSGNFLKEVNAVSYATPKIFCPENGIRHVVDEIGKFL